MVIERREIGPERATGKSVRSYSWHQPPGVLKATRMICLNS